MDVMHADGSMVFVPSRDMSELAHAMGRPRNQMGSAYAEGLVGLPLAALPIADLLLGGHAAVMHRDDDMSLLPGQPEVMALLGVETIGVVASTAQLAGSATPWGIAASFTYPDRIQPDLGSVTTVRKLLDADTADIFALAIRAT
ncbi:MAG: hypothetical protein K1X95_13085 [Acidimicrobiia bacterium]|nr:hypothetical protein [Acidimicrobiia bacterium]